MRSKVIAHLLDIMPAGLGVDGTRPDLYSLLLCVKSADHLLHMVDLVSSLLYISVGILFLQAKEDIIMV